MAQDQRIVTLLPSATEIVYALGLEPVATSHECDYPPAANAKPAVNYSRVDPEASTHEINEQVAQADRGDGVYGIDVEALARADPDLIITQGICEVCAVDRVLVEDAVERIDADPEVLTTDPHSLEDVLDDVARIGRAVGREERARELVAELEARIDRVGTGVEDLAPDECPRVAVLDWTDPVMVAGHWVPGMVESAGGQCGLEEPGGRSRPREWTRIREYDPEVLVVAPCGFDLEQTRENLADLRDREGWADLTAVREGRAYAMDGHGHVNRPGPRLVDSLEALAGVIHPDRFDRPAPDVARPLADLAPSPE
jgi:iron complex transport system substrate-binding protein